MSAPGAFFLLFLFLVGQPDAVYDAQFDTLEECIRMGNLHLTGINGPVYDYQCKFIVES